LKEKSEKDYSMPLKITFLSSGFSWAATYVLSKVENHIATFSCFINIGNTSGVNYKDCNIKLLDKKIEYTVVPPKSKPMFDFSYSGSGSYNEMKETQKNLRIRYFSKHRYLFFKYYIVF